MALALGQVVSELQRLAPLAWAASWDNVGLLLGERAQPAQRALLAIDMTEAVLDEAQALGSQLLVAYHPPWFRPAKKMVGPGGLWRAAKMGLAVYSPHTALDVAEGGTNDVLARAAGLIDWRALEPLPAAVTGGGEDGRRGQGRVGTLPASVDLHALGRRLAAALGAHGTRLVEAAPAARAADGGVARVALCAGAGASLLDAAVAAQADVFVTGEMGHHDALRARAAGLHVICLGHAASEAMALPPLARALRRALPELTVEVARTPAEIFVPLAAS